MVNIERFDWSLITLRSLLLMGCPSAFNAFKVYFKLFFNDLYSAPLSWGSEALCSIIFLTSSLSRSVAMDCACFLIVSKDDLIDLHFDSTLLMFSFDLTLSKNECDIACLMYAFNRSVSISSFLGFSCWSLLF